MYKNLLSVFKHYIENFKIQKMYEIKILKEKILIYLEISLVLI